MAAAAAGDGAPGHGEVSMVPAEEPVERTPVETPSGADSPGPSAKARLDSDLNVADLPEEDKPDDEAIEEEDHEGDEANSEGKSARSGGGHGEEDDHEEGDEEETPSELERAEAKRKAERRLEREKLMHENVTLQHSSSSCKFYPRTLCEGAIGWTDRKYTYSEVPEEMVDAVFFAGTHVKVPGGTLTLTSLGLDGTVYLWAKLPQKSGGFDTLGWTEIGTMQFAETDTVTIFKQDMAADTAADIPASHPWIGGVAFQMAPDAVPEPDAPPADEGPQDKWCLTRCCKKFVKSPPDWLDNLITTSNPLDDLERRFVTPWLDASLRRAVEAELQRSACDARLVPWRGGFLSRWLCSPCRSSQGIEAWTFEADEVLEAFRRKRPRQDHTKLEKALGGALPPTRALGVVAAHFFAAMFAALCLYLLVAFPVFASNAIAAEAGSGALTDAPTKQPAVAGAAVSLRPLWEYPLLSRDELRRIEDVVFVHNQATHVVRVSVLLKEVSGAVRISCADGASIRVEPRGLAFWTPKGRAEIALDDTEAWRQMGSSADLALVTSGALAAHTVTVA